MAGLLDWLTDGSLFGSSSASADAPTNNFLSGTASLYPPPSASASAAPSVPSPTPTPDLPPDPTGGVAAPPTIPDTPTPADAPSGLSGAVPIPQPRPADADAALPIPAPAAPPSVAPPPPAISGPVPIPAAPPAVIPAGPAGAPMSIAPDAAPPAAPAPGGFMSRFKSALGGGLGAGLSAAGNSAGKSPFQAFASGAGATLSGINDEQHKNTKDAQGYLTAAIAAKKANDTAGYNTNMMQFHLAKLKQEQEEAASKDAAKTTAANKNDSPTQLYLSAQRLVEPDRRALNTTLATMQKNGEPPEAIAKAKAEAEAQISARLADHYAAVGIHPQTAAQIGAQPGNSEKNPIDAGQAGITEKNIAQKLQPGQYYINPADKKLYQYKGPTPAVGSAPSSKPSAKDVPDPPSSTRLKMSELTADAE